MKKYKYNPRNEKHRQRLTEQILKVLLSLGYILDPEYPYTRVFIKRLPDGRTIKVFTSISPSTNEVCDAGADAIRVITVIKGQNECYQCLYRTKINRAGTISSIIDRMIKAMETATHIEDWQGCIEKAENLHKQ